METESLAPATVHASDVTGKPRMAVDRDVDELVDVVVIESALNMMMVCDETAGENRASREIGGLGRIRRAAKQNWARLGEAEVIAVVESDPPNQALNCLELQRAHVRAKQRKENKDLQCDVTWGC